MYVEKVTLNNFCQHEKLEATFGPGVIGIIGPNGAGKSNLIHGLLFGFTGYTNGKKADEIAHGADDGTAEVEFMAGGTKGVIKRALKTSRCLLRIGEARFGSATEVDRAMEPVIGDAAVLMNLIFARQGAIEGVLFLRPSDRARQFQALFGTQNAELIRQLFYDELSAIPAAPNEAVIKELEDDKANVAASLLEKERELPAAAAGRLGADEQASFNRVIRAHDEQAANEAAYAAAKLERDTLGARLRETRHLAKEYGDTVDSINAAIASLQPVAERASAELAAAGAAVEHNARLAGLRADKARWDEVRRAPEPVCPGALNNVPMLKAKLEIARVECVTSRRVVEAGKQHKGGKCPTCNQPLTAEHVAEHAARRAKWEPELVQLESIVAGYEALAVEHAADKQTWDAGQRTAGTELARIEKALQDAGPDRPVPSGARKAEMEKLVGDYGLNKTRLHAASTNLAAAQATATQLQLGWDAVVKRVEDCEQRLPKRPVTKDERDVAAKLIEGHTEAMMRFATVSAQMQSLTERQAELGRRIEAAKALAGRYERLKAWRQLLERGRLILHRDQLPNLVARSYLVALNAQLARYLEMFDSPFGARVLDDLSIECRFVDKLMPAERLSGGEKVVLGIAFRFVVYALFASDLGMLVLDEPTVFLDDGRIDSLCAVLEKVRGYSRQAGLQVILITHEDRLAAVCDRVIRLG